MATISFKENLSVSNRKKIKEISEALKMPKSSKVQSAQPKELPKDAGAIWFKR